MGNICSTTHNGGGLKQRVGNHHYIAERGDKSHRNLKQRRLFLGIQGMENV